MRKALFYVLTCFVLICIVSLFYYIIQALDDVFEAEAVITRENSANYRIIFEPYNENILLQNALSNFVYGEGGKTNEELMLRFEIYWSRLPLILHSKEAKSLINIPNIKSIINSFIADLMIIEDDLNNLKIGNYKKRKEIITILRKHADILSQMRIDTDLILRKYNEHNIEIKNKLRNSIFYGLIISTIAIIAVFLLFIFQLVKKSKLSITLNKQSEDLKKLANSLDKTVIERTHQLSELNTSLKLEIKEREEIEKRIIHQAYHDSLTGLPNRLLILDRLHVAISKAKRNDDSVAVLFLDLDDFKKVNDSLGHHMGDKLLIEASLRLQRIIRADDSVGRIGGDEFIIILEHSLNIYNIQSITDKILKKLSDVYKIEGRELLVSASIGVAFYPNDGENPDALLKAADSAMYNSKDAGRNTFSYYTDELNHAMDRRLSIESELVGSLERNEFTLVFQPKLNFTTGEITSVEALLRWNNIKLGNVTPSEFIPIVEQSSLIDDIAQFVLDRSLQLVSKIRNSTHPSFSIAVNFSPQQFRSNNLVSDIEKALKKYNLNGNALEIEITEGVLFKDISMVSDLFGQLITLGVALSMDDFGTGYSSLSYLRQYPFSILKIDRSFIIELDHGTRDKELANATIAMAHSLKIKVVAEGIETKSQYDYLKQQGCDYGQGFYISKPINENALIELLQQN